MCSTLIEYGALISVTLMPSTVSPSLTRIWPKLTVSPKTLVGAGPV
jgi:hypothetical protein